MGKVCSNGLQGGKDISVLHNPVPHEIVCYHCQQCAEKIFKAYLIAQSEPYIKTHDLNILLNMCVNHNDAFDNYAEVCITLTSYAILTRYPMGEDAITEQDMKTALKNAFEILEFTNARISEISDQQSN